MENKLILLSCLILSFLITTSNAEESMQANKGFHKTILHDLATNSEKAPLDSYSIKLINEKNDLAQLDVFCSAHLAFQVTQEEIDYSGLNFKEIENDMRDNQEYKRNGLIDNVFGIYGFYSIVNKESSPLIGIIRMFGAVRNESGLEGYAECEMTMHPDHRGKGLGTIFHKHFHEQIISPILKTTIKFQGNNFMTFYGTVGYIHAKNVASRRLVTKLGFVPVKLSCKSYLGGKETLQIIYINPPRGDSFQVGISEDVKKIILENDPNKNIDIILTNLKQEKLVQDVFLGLNQITLQRGILPAKDFEIRIYIESIKRSFLAFLNFCPPQFVLTRLAQEAALYNTSLKYLKDKTLETIKDGPFETFLKTQYRDKRNELEMALK